MGSQGGCFLLPVSSFHQLYQYFPDIVLLHFTVSFSEFLVRIINSPRLQ